MTSAKLLSPSVLQHLWYVMKRKFLQTLDSDELDIRLTGLGSEAHLQGHHISEFFKRIRNCSSQSVCANIAA